MATLLAGALDQRGYVCEETICWQIWDEERIELKDKRFSAIEEYCVIESVVGPAMQSFAFVQTNGFEGMPSKLGMEKRRWAVWRTQTKAVIRKGRHLLI